MVEHQSGPNQSPLTRSERMATAIVLSNGEFVNVPDGADLETFRKLQEARLRLIANPKKSPKRKSSPSRSRKSGKRTLRSTVPFALSLSSAERQAERRTSATAELVTRVNTKEPEPRFVAGWLEVF